MELQSISTISKQFNVSVRTLRYYEQIGLIPSVRKEEGSYRFYDELTVKRLQQIFILKKLRIPLKQIQAILNSSDAILAIETFRQSVAELDKEITALSTIRSTLQTLIEHIGYNTRVDAEFLSRIDVIDIVNSLTPSQIRLKESRNMKDLNKADESLTKIKDRDVRIVFLPPSIVIASDYIHYEADNATRKALDQFVSVKELIQSKPDIRYYDFIRPNPGNTGEYGYEIWITIPENTEVPEKFNKKKFDGGLYAAYTIYANEWDMWEQLVS